MKFQFNGNTYWMQPGDKVPPGFGEDSGKILSEVLNMTSDQIIAAQKEFDTNKARQLRANEYPSFADQFDMIYHQGIDAWKAKIEEIKAKYPKPE